MITFDNFFQEIMSKNCPSQLRYGQFVYNELYKINPLIADYIDKTFILFEKDTLSFEIWKRIEECFYNQFFKDNYIKIEIPNGYKIESINLHTVKTGYEILLKKIINE